VAGLLAGRLPASAAAHAADMNLEQLTAQFNWAADQTRVIALLSPITDLSAGGSAVEQIL